VAADQPKLPLSPIEMNPLDADRQIDQMIAFIKQEAKEKAEEIRIKTEKEFMADKLSYETQQNFIIRQEHEKMKKDLLIQKRIEKSKKLSEARFTVMRKRDEKINMLKKEVLNKLSDVSKKPEYKSLIRFLISQGLVTLQEPIVLLQCRKEDLQIVKDQLDEGVKQYIKTMQVGAKTTPEVRVTVDEVNFLPPGPVAGQATNSCCGGVQLSCRGGQILCRNTLDHRLDLAFEALKPQIRGVLFGVRAKAVSKPTIEHEH